MKETGNARQSMMNRWREYRPSKKGTFFLMAGAVAATMYLGFSSGAWVSSSKASQIARAEVRQATMELAGDWCAQRFLADADAIERLSELQGMRSRFQRTQYVESGDWALMPGETRPNRRISSHCGDILAEWERGDPDADETSVGQVRTDAT